MVPERQMESTLKYLIIEDDDFDRLSLENEAQKFPFLKKVAAGSHPLQAAELIAQCRPRIFFSSTLKCRG